MVRRVLTSLPAGTLLKAFLKAFSLEKFDSFSNRCIQMERKMKIMKAILPALFTVLLFMPPFVSGARAELNIDVQFGAPYYYAPPPPPVVRYYREEPVVVYRRPPHRHRRYYDCDGPGCRYRPGPDAHYRRFHDRYHD